MEHAELPPSSAERIELCNGSARMEAMFPDEDGTIDAREGAAVHWAGQVILEGDSVCVGLVAANDVTLNEEMCDAAEMYADTIMRRGPVGSIEKTIKQAVLHVKNWGTPDHWYYCPVTRTLWIDDLKYGHRIIDVYMNWQLINYAALILALLGLTGEDDIKVVFTIVQPRSYYHRDGPVRTWNTTSGALRKPWARLIRAFEAAVLPAVKVTPHPNACRDCKARHVCEGAAAAAYIGVDMAYQSEPLELSPEALSREYRMLLQAESFITARRKGIADSITQTIRRNRSVPYFGLDRKPGREVWNDDAVANGVVDIAAAYGVDIVTDDVPLMTPKQAIKAGVPVHVVKLFSRTNTGGVELVEDDGTRAAQIFNQGG